MAKRSLSRVYGTKGQALVVYSLILVLVAIAVFVVLGQLGETVRDSYVSVNEALQGGGSGGSGSDGHGSR